MESDSFEFCGDRKDPGNDTERDKETGSTKRGKSWSRRGRICNVLYWPKNLVEGCVIKTATHATFDLVFWPAEYISFAYVGELASHSWTHQRCVGSSNRGAVESRNHLLKRVLKSNYSRPNLLSTIVSWQFQI